MASDVESERLRECREGNVPWRKWGPYLSERQWGTVREDYSDNGDAWSYFSHDQARSRAYGWGEDGLAGFADDKGLLCLALALWNGADPILKERLFGLTNAEGNHGEDVKEYYYYLDATPTHSYMRWLYKYPQRAFPYEALVTTNRNRSRREPEFELIDTGVFADDAYFDVVVEYAKAEPEDILMRVEAFNRGAQPAALHLLPTLWFRNVWTANPDAQRPVVRRADAPAAISVIAATHPQLGDYWLACAAAPPLLFTENETNRERLFGQPNRTPYVKDAFHRVLVRGRDRGGEPGRHRDEGGGALPAGHPGRRLHRTPPPPDRRAARQRVGGGRTVRRDRADAARRGGRILRQHHARWRQQTTRAWCCARRSLACCGASSTISSISTTG